MSSAVQINLNARLHIERININDVEHFVGFWLSGMMIKQWLKLLLSVSLVLALESFFDSEIKVEASFSVSLSHYSFSDLPLYPPKGQTSTYFTN